MEPRVPIQERVPCGHHSERERCIRFALSVASEGKKFRSPVAPVTSAAVHVSCGVRCGAGISGVPSL